MSFLGKPVSTFPGHALDFCVGACPFRKTGIHFSGACADHRIDATRPLAGGLREIARPASKHAISRRGYQAERGDHAQQCNQVRRYVSRFHSTGHHRFAARRPQQTRRLRISICRDAASYVWPNSLIRTSGQPARRSHTRLIASFAATRSSVAYSTQRVIRAAKRRHVLRSGAL